MGIPDIMRGWKPIPWTLAHVARLGRIPDSILAQRTGRTIKAVVRPVAERLRLDGLKLWFDERVLDPGDSIPAKIEAALEHSRVLVLCMSDHAFGSDWAQSEARTFRFRDPLNQERRLIPLRFDDAWLAPSIQR